MNWAENVENLEKVSVDPLAPSEIVDTSKILNEAIDRLKQNETKRQESELANERAKLSQQLAHDIRSPLSTLQVLVNELEGKGLPHFELLRGCANRISDIASGLQKGVEKAIVAGGSTVSIERTVQVIVAEKQVQHQIPIEVANFNVGRETRVAMAEVELGRVISNILDNAIEAVQSNRSVGKIQLNISPDESRGGDFIQISITDNGPGIPRSIIREVGRRGSTFGKLKGSGLGLYNSRQLLKGRGGRLTIRSDGRTGTTVDIQVPINKLH